MQTVVNRKLAFGVEGSFYDDSPRRVDPYVVSSGSIGIAYTVNSADPTKADKGGTGTFAGIAVSPKEYPLDSLTPSLEFVNGAVAQLATMGRILIKCPASKTVKVGQVAEYNNTTGVISAIDASAPASSGCTKIENSKFVLVAAAAGELCVLQLG